MMIRLMKGLYYRTKFVLTYPGFKGKRLKLMKYGIGEYDITKEEEYAFKSNIAVIIIFCLGFLSILNQVFFNSGYLYLFNGLGSIIMLFIIFKYWGG